MAWALIIGGIVMWIVDAVYERSKHQAFARGKLTEDMEQMSVGPGHLDRLLPDILGGLPRHLALHVHHHRRRVGRHEPSRGAGVLLLSLHADDGGRHLYDLFKSLRPHHGEPSAIGSMPSDAHSWIVLAIGFVVSFIVAYGVVAWFMNWVRTRGFTVFAIYRILLGAFVLWWVARLPGVILAICMRRCSPWRPATVTVLFPARAFAARSRDEATSKGNGRLQWGLLDGESRTKSGLR